MDVEMKPMAQEMSEVPDELREMGLDYMLE
jgi:hypothetical protein